IHDVQQLLGRGLGARQDARAQPRHRKDGLADGARDSGLGHGGLRSGQCTLIGRRAARANATDRPSFPNSSVAGPFRRSWHSARPHRRDPSERPPMLRISLIAAALVLAACTPPADRQEAEGAPQDAAPSDITVPADLVMPPEEADVPPATGMAPGDAMPD